MLHGGCRDLTPDNFQHAGLGVDRYDLRAARYGKRGDRARASSGVEDTASSGDQGGVEQGGRRVGTERAEAPLVGGGQSVPPDALVLIECRRRLSLVRRPHCPWR